MRKLTRPTRKINTVRKPLGITTINQMLEMSAEMHGDRTAYLHPRNNFIIKISFNQVLERVKRLARQLKDLGLGFGDNIALIGDNGPEWGISYFSVTWIGATVIPLDARAPVDSHRFVLRFSSAKAIIVDASHLSDIKSIEHELIDLKHIILMESFDEIFNKYHKGIESEGISEDQILQILFTSGTTGNPKGVMLTHKNVMSNVEDMYSIIELSPEDRAFSILPVHHSYECTCGLIGPFYNGTGVFYARSLRPREMLEDLKTASPTIWLNTPLILEKLYLRLTKELANQRGIRSIFAKALPKRLIGKKIKNNLGLENIKYIVCGGAALPNWVSTGLEELGFPILQGYGLSETSPLVSVNPPSNPKNMSVGMIIKSNEVEIFDVDSEGNGEIVVKGPNVMKGYYKNEIATKEVFTPEGWFLTGDLGYFDDEGYLYITGRKKSLIVTKGGKNVFPEEIEEKLTKSRFIEEALVYSPDDKNIHALIYPNIDEVISTLGLQGFESSEDSIWNLLKTEIRTINQDLEAHKKINNFAIRLEEFPKTTTRKIKRYLFKNISLEPEQKVIRDHN